MKKYIVLGFKGMLGRYMFTHFGNETDASIGIGRNQINAENVAPIHIREILLAADALRSGDSVVVNCIGMIKPQVDKYGVEAAMEVNSIFPRMLANVCEKLDFPLIHITTDCVFSGRRGDYTEKDPHDALDVYGKTKSLGEPENCTVIRTSIIGEEVGQSRSLISWIKSQAGKTANGFTDHFWNGVTCLQLAKVVQQIAENDSYWKGVRHVFSPTQVSKKELLSLIDNVYNLNIDVVPKAGGLCDRTLDTVYETRIVVPELKQQIEEMKNFQL